MIAGETVSVRLRTSSGRDRLGNLVESYADPADVGDVVVAPATPADGDIDADRPDAMLSRLTLHFPRGYAHDLRGALVYVRGRRYRVVGSPQPYTESNVPGPWTMPVVVERTDG